MADRIARPRQGFHPQRKWRLLLAASHQHTGDPPIRHGPARTIGLGWPPHDWTPDTLSFQRAVSATVCFRRSRRQIHAQRLMKQIQVSKVGGPEELKLVDAPKPTPGAGQALVRIAASGVNYIDVYFRTGVNKAELPLTPGNEASGEVESVGSGVTVVKPGDRVAYSMTRGSYSEYALVPAEQLVPLPDTVDMKTAAAAMLQGMTAHYLTHSTWPLKAGDKVLVHAAAGGAGLLIV